MSKLFRNFKIGFCFLALISCGIGKKGDKNSGPPRSETYSIYLDEWEGVKTSSTSVVGHIPAITQINVVNNEVESVFFAKWNNLPSVPLVLLSEDTFDATYTGDGTRFGLLDTYIQEEYLQVKFSITIRDDQILTCLIELYTNNFQGFETISSQVPSGRTFTRNRIQFNKVK